MTGPNCVRLKNLAWVWGKMGRLLHKFQYKNELLYSALCLHNITLVTTCQGILEAKGTGTPVRRTALVLHELNSEVRLRWIKTKAMRAEEKDKCQRFGGL